MIKIKSENLKACARIFKSAYKVCKKNDNLENYILNLKSIKTLNIDGNEVKLTVDSDAIIASGIRFGMTHIVTKDGEAHYTIILEPICKDMGSDLCQFIIYHELGHLVNEVFGKYFFNRNRNLENEMNADLYAAKHIGSKRALSALNTLSSQKGIDRAEIRQRMKAIEMYSIANPDTTK